MRRIGVALAATLAAMAQAPALGADVAWTRTETASTTNVERGVRVIRGPIRRLPPASPSADPGTSDLEISLAGRPPATNVIRTEKKIVVVNCFRPRRLTTHGFLGVRRYNRSFGGFGSPSFGFDGYRRERLANC